MNSIRRRACVGACTTLGPVGKHATLCTGVQTRGGGTLLLKCFFKKTGFSVSKAVQNTQGQSGQNEVFLRINKTLFFCSFFVSCPSKLYSTAACSCCAFAFDRKSPQSALGKGQRWLGLLNKSRGLAKTTNDKLLRGWRRIRAP